MLKRDGAIIDPIPDWIFRRARHIATRPVLKEIGEAMTAKTGRPRTHSWDTLFTLLAIAAVNSKNDLFVADAVRAGTVLTEGQIEYLEASLEEGSTKIGLRKPVSYRQMESALASLASAFQPRVNVLTGEVHLPRVSMSLDVFTTRLVSEVLPRSLRRSKTIALDSTDAESHFARRSWTPDKTSDAVDGDLPEKEVQLPEKRRNHSGYPKEGSDGRHIHCYDEDVREGYRSGKNLSKKGVFLGFDLHLATTVPELGAEGFASLIIGLVVRPAGDAKGEAGIALIDSMDESGLPTSTVLADRGYTFLVADSWADQLMQRGIEQVLDLHKNQRKTEPGPLDGTIWVDGAVFSDALPEDLRKLPGFPLGQTAAEKAELVKKYDEREPYAFKPHGKPDLKEGKQRVRGPAQDGRLRCPNFPASMRKDAAGRPQTNCAPGTCSCGRAPTLGPDDMTRERQLVRFGTTAWSQSYGRRSAIESANAGLKTHQAKLDRGSTRVLGRTKTTILLAFIIAAANIRILLDCYGFDPGIPHADDVNVRPLPTTSTAEHRKRRFARRKGRSPVQTTGPPDAPPDWKHANDPEEEHT